VFHDFAEGKGIFFGNDFVRDGHNFVGLERDRRMIATCTRQILTWVPTISGGEISPGDL
jgi:hypothetical protein